jgi:hypothetical protein
VKIRIFGSARPIIPCWSPNDLGHFWRAANKVYSAPNRALIYPGKKFGLRKQPLAVACVVSIYWKIYPVYSVLVQAEKVRRGWDFDTT